MADQKISDLASLTGAELVSGDLFEVVDVSDTSGVNSGAGGKNKKITRDELTFGVLGGRATGGNQAEGVSASTRYFAMTTTLTASRTVTLPAIAGVPAGVDITVADEGAIGTTGFTIIVRGSTTETIDGVAFATNYPVIREPYGSFTFRSTGAGWIITNRRPAVDVQRFTAAGTGTWRKPFGCSRIRGALIGGGGGGGGGSRSTTGQNGSGGGGGQAGGVTVFETPIVDLAVTEQAIVGAGGTAGAGKTLSAGVGSPGGAGGNTTFSVGGTTIAWTAQGGAGGAGGNNTDTATGGAGGTAYGYGTSRGANGGDGGANSAVPGTSGFAPSGGAGGATSSSGGNPLLIPPGGGGGGGGTSTNTGASAGGAGGSTGGGIGGSSATNYGVGLTGGSGGAGGAGGGVGGAGAACTTITAGAVANADSGGSGGGGGGGSTGTAAAGAGGAGGLYGGGAGGGGGGFGQNGGTGGTGARGAAIITSF